MNYRVVLTRSAVRRLNRVSAEARARIAEAIAQLGGNPRPAGCVKLKGRAEWRLRVGDYRVLYRVDDAELTVTVVDVGHRSDVYD